MLVLKGWTVMEALRSGARSKREHRRLREATAAPSKHFGVFHNRRDPRSPTCPCGALN